MPYYAIAEVELGKRKTRKNVFLKDLLSRTGHRQWGKSFAKVPSAA
jgi:hypothetical protein